MRPESSPAVVLRTRDFAESDRIITVLSRDAGKLSGIAKGAKRSRRRFAALGLFSHVRLDFRHKPAAELAFFEAAMMLDPFQGILESLERYAAASHVVELADKMTAEREVGDRLYGVVLAALARIDAAEPGPTTLRRFELAVLAASGYRPDLSHCVSCRTRIAGAASARLAPEDDGGLLCPACAARARGGPTLSRETLECLAHLQQVAARALPASAGPDHPELLFADEEVDEVADTRLSRRAESELQAALGFLLAPRLRGRLRALELMGPVLRGGTEEPFRA